MRCLKIICNGKKSLRKTVVLQKNVTEVDGATIHQVADKSPTSGKSFTLYSKLNKY